MFIVEFTNPLKNLTVVIPLFMFLIACYALISSSIIEGYSMKNKIPRTQQYTSSNLAEPKNGYCYVGQENGHRSCIHVGVNDICKSNEIYETKEICKNPDVRI